MHLVLVRWKEELFSVQSLDVDFFNFFPLRLTEILKIDFHYLKTLK